MIFKFTRDNGGASMVLTALALGMFAGICAIAVDYGYAVVMKQRLQGSADAAAMAAIIEIPDTSAAETAAIDYASRDMPVAQHGSVVVAADVEPGSWDMDNRTFTAGGSPTDAVRITARRSQANGNALGMFFARILGIASSNVSAFAIAWKSEPGECVVTLEEDDTGLYVNSSSSVTTENCSVQVNSDDSKAIESNSGSTVDAGSGEICVVGNTSGGGISPSPTTGCSAMPDPLASLSPPSYGGCNHSDKVVVEDGDTETLSPGRYCKGIEINSGGVANFSPGVYVIEGDKFSVNSDAVANGTGVHFYLRDKDALIHFNSDSTVNFSAPTSGDMSGILFYSDRNIGDEMDHEINSRSSSVLNGVTYLPTGNLAVNSESTLGGANSCIKLITLRLEVNSDSTLHIGDNFGSSGCGVPLPTIMAGAIRLVR